MYKRQVIYRTVPVGMVFADDITDHTGAFLVRTGIGIRHLRLREQDTPCLLYTSGQSRHVGVACPVGYGNNYFITGINDAHQHIEQRLSLIHI